MAKSGKTSRNAGRAPRKKQTKSAKAVPAEAVAAALSSNALGNDNGHRKKPKAIVPGGIVDRVKDENNDGAADIEDVKLFLKKNKANRIALKGNDQYPGGDFRSDHAFRRILP